jgi:hypothetical protein
MIPQKVNVQAPIHKKKILHMTAIGGCSVEELATSKTTSMAHRLLPILQICNTSTPSTDRGLTSLKCCGWACNHGRAFLCSAFNVDFNPIGSIMAEESYDGGREAAESYDRLTVSSSLKRSKFCKKHFIFIETFKLSLLLKHLTFNADFRSHFFVAVFLKLSKFHKNCFSFNEIFNFWLFFVEILHFNFRETFNVSQKLIPFYWNFELFVTSFRGNFCETFKVFFTKIISHTLKLPNFCDDSSSRFKVSRKLFHIYWNFQSFTKIFSLLLERSQSFTKIVSLLLKLSTRGANFSFRFFSSIFVKLSMFDENFFIFIETFNFSRRWGTFYENSFTLIENFNFL